MSQGSAGADGADNATAETQPLLSLVGGEPTAAELAALTVVVDALVRGGSQPTACDRPGSRWAAKEHSMRPHLRPGPGAWRASALPR
jgi:hypothetical protein